MIPEFDSDKTEYTKTEYFEKFVKPKITDEFLETLVELCRYVGWDSDNYVINSFVHSLFKDVGKQELFKDDESDVYEFKSKEESED